MSAVLLTIFAPIIGGLIFGIERVVRARMQNRMGPPVLQPFYDFIKLMEKRPLMVHSFHDLWVLYILSLLGLQWQY